MSFVAKGKKSLNDQNQDKQTPHTVLQKLSPKTTHVPSTLVGTVFPLGIIRASMRSLINSLSPGVERNIGFFHFVCVPCKCHPDAKG